MKKYFKKMVKISVKQGLILVGIFAVLGFGVRAADQLQQSYRSVYNATTVGVANGINSFNSDKIEERGSCYKIASNTCGSDVFIPTASSPERSAFVNNHPSCIQLTGCVAAPTTFCNPDCPYPDTQICDQWGDNCITWSMCNSTIGTGGEYYTGNDINSVDSHGWPYGKLYTQYEKDQGCNIAGCRVAEASDYQTTWNNLGCPGIDFSAWDYANNLDLPVECAAMINQLKLPKAGFMNAYYRDSGGGKDLLDYYDSTGINEAGYYRFRLSVSGSIYQAWNNLGLGIGVSLGDEWNGYTYYSGFYSLAADRAAINGGFLDASYIDDGGDKLSVRCVAGTIPTCPGTAGKINRFGNCMNRGDYLCKATVPSVCAPYADAFTWVNNAQPGDHCGWNSQGSVGDGDSAPVPGDLAWKAESNYRQKYKCVQVPLARWYCSKNGLATYTSLSSCNSACGGQQCIQGTCAGGSQNCPSPTIQGDVKWYPYDRGNYTPQPTLVP